MILCGMTGACGTLHVTREELDGYLKNGCPSCGTPAEPEPSDAERQRIWDEPDYNWFPPEGTYLVAGFGLMGGGYGAYVVCDGCGFMAKCVEEDE